MRRRRLLLLSVCVSLSLGLGLAEATEISSSPSAPTPDRAPAPLRRSPRGSPGPGCRRCELHRAAGRASVTGGPGGPARAGRRPGSPPPAAPGWLRQQLPAAFLVVFFLNQRDPLCCFFFFFNGKGDKLYRRPLWLFPTSPRRAPHNSRRRCDLLAKRKSFKIPFARGALPDFPGGIAEQL